MTTAETAASSLRIARSTRITIQAAPDEAFPLFTPQGEALWSEEWEPVHHHPPTGIPEVGAVFTTPDGPGGDRVWTVTEYDPQHHRIGYLCVSPGDLHSQISITCRKDDAGNSAVDVTYTFTSLSVEGRRQLEGMSETAFAEWIGYWEHAIGEYLRSGGSRT